MPINPGKMGTTIERFYEECRVPIVTTFHSAYTLRQWFKLLVPLESKKLGNIETYLRVVYDYWTHLLNYRTFGLLNRRKLDPNRAGIVFSKYLARLIPGSHFIYHGGEPAIKPPMNKKDARSILSLPADTKIALATGFITATKGWDIYPKNEASRRLEDRYKQLKELLQ